MRDLPRLIALSPGDLAVAAAPRRFCAALARALDAGLPGLLLREPELSDRAYLELAAEVRRLFALHERPWFAVHDRAHLARALEADALHLGFRSLPAEVLRPWLGSEIALGLSTHARDEPASWRAADYLFHGPLHETPSKRGRLEPLGLAGLARALEVAPAPLLALGGVRAEDVASVCAAGAHGVAVRGGIFGAPDAGRATAGYLNVLAACAHG